MTKEKLNELLGRAWSIENMEAHGAIGRKLEKVGSLPGPGRKYNIYLDDKGDSWYEDVMQKDGREVSMYEYLFGRKEPIQYRLSRRR